VKLQSSLGLSPPVQKIYLTGKRPGWISPAPAIAGLILTCGPTRPAMLPYCGAGTGRPGACPAPAIAGFVLMYGVPGWGLIMGGIEVFL
jgi:hypothetical protein